MLESAMANRPRRNKVPSRSASSTNRNTEALTAVKCVWILADSDIAFTGWANGQKLNGWEIPRFEFQVCTQMLDWIGDGKARYDREKDAFITVRQNAQEETWPPPETARFCPPDP